ncbi:3'-5' exonuclease, partial [Clostridium tarantellae]
MKYIIYDLEFNQSYIPDKEKIKNSNFKLPFEIIQIGAIKLDESLNLISTFNSLIKPTLYTNVHPYVENLTKITNEKLKFCNNFLTVYNKFLNFIGEKDVVICVWGLADIKEFLRNLEFQKINTNSFPKNYIDVQNCTSKYFNVPKGSKIGLKNAVQLLNIQIKNEFHDAFNDAYYTTEVFKKIYKSINLNPILYTPNKSKKITQIKKQINTKALINQFKKMYKRNLSADEEAMIKLAYIMGRTN